MQTIRLTVFRKRKVDGECTPTYEFDLIRKFNNQPLFALYIFVTAMASSNLVR